MQIAIFCADVGSIKSGKFGWACVLGDVDKDNKTIGKCKENPSGFCKDDFKDIEKFKEKIKYFIEENIKVAIGFECPLFIPVKEDPLTLTSARKSEGNRPWCAQAGATALSVGLVEILWLLRSLKKELKCVPSFTFSWEKFLECPGSKIFFWEAMVMGKAKSKDNDFSHVEDAQIAVEAFCEKIGQSVKEENSYPVFSIIGACLLWAEWTKDTDVLKERVVLIEA